MRRLRKYLLGICMMVLIGPVVLLADTQRIILTQTPCQFVEAEGVDHHFHSRVSADCERINAQTAKERLQQVKVLKLKPGHYVFRVYNRNVPYVLGFWLRGDGLSRLTLPSVSGGGVEMGNYKDYPIELRVGNYVYSCPLNPTPDYRLIVSE